MPPTSSPALVAAARTPMGRGPPHGASSLTGGAGSAVESFESVDAVERRARRGLRCGGVAPRRRRDDVLRLAFEPLGGGGIRLREGRPHPRPRFARVLRGRARARRRTRLRLELHLTQEDIEAHHVERDRRVASTSRSRISRSGWARASLGSRRLRTTTRRCRSISSSGRCSPPTRPRVASSGGSSRSGPPVGAPRLPSKVRTRIGSFRRGTDALASTCHARANSGHFGSRPSGDGRTREPS